jgi:hypothetical protein
MKHLILLLLLLPNLSFAQTAEGATFHDSIDDGSTRINFIIAPQRQPEQRHNLYLELGGPGGLGSINYEWRFLKRGKFRMMLRPGFGASPLAGDSGGAAFLFPVMIHSTIGKVHNLDLGVGQTFALTTNQDFYLYTPISVGYRLEPTKSRLFYRIAYTPIMSTYSGFEVTHWGGITIGFKLKPNYR